MDALTGACVVAAVAPVLVVLALWAAHRWKYRAIPGPFAPPLIGNLPDLLKYGFHEYLDMCRRKYGRVFKVYIGSTPFFVVADPDAARRVNFRLMDRQLGPQLSADKKGRDITAMLGLATANGEEWRALRLAWQPAFASGSLERYCLLMDKCALRLCEQLGEAAAEGRSLDIWRALGTMTMGVVGTTAFGIDFHTMDDPGSAHYSEGRDLVEASGLVFSSTSIISASPYQALLVMLPKAAKAVQWLAARLPDAKLIALTEARAKIREVSRKLIDRWRAEHGAAAAVAAAAAAASSGPAPAGDAGAEQPLVEDVPTLVAAAPPAEGGAGESGKAGTSGLPVVEAKAAGGDSGSEDAPAAAGRDQAAGGGAKRPVAAGEEGKGSKFGAGVEPGSFLGLLLGARERGRKADGGGGGDKAPFSDDVIIAQGNTFILAGYETTANTLAYCVYNIAACPRARARLLAEIDAFGRDRDVTHADLGSFPYTEAVIKESLRLYPPATLTNRRVARDDQAVELAPGVRLGKGASVFTAIYCFQRDEAFWPRALEFLPERFLPDGSALASSNENAWTPFGAGSRMCIGWRFALNEAKIALVRLHQRFTFELAPGQVPLKLKQALTLAPAEGVWVTPVARGPAGEAGGRGVGGADEPTAAAAPAPVAA